jgi:hypothetical protein
MHLLQKMGDVVVFSPNRQLSRFLPDHSDEGMIGKIQIYITDFTPDEVWEKVQRNPDSFDHILFDVRDQVVEGADLNIHILGSEFEDGELDFLNDCVEDVHYIKVMYDGKQSKNKDTYNVKLDEGYLLIIERMERNSVVAPIRNKQLAEALGRIMDGVSGHSGKTIRSALMERRRF